LASYSACGAIFSILARAREMAGEIGKEDAIRSFSAAQLLTNDGIRVSFLQTFSGLKGLTSHHLYAKDQA